MTTDTLSDARKAGWLWIDHAVIDAYAPQIGAYGLALYTVLARYADRNGCSFPSYQTLAEKLALSRNTIIKAMKLLIDVGLVTVTPRANKDGAPESNLYTLCTPGGSAPHALPSAGDALGVVHDVHQGSAPGALKQDLINKRERRAARATTPPPKAAPDPTLDHPAVRVYRDLVRLTPNPTQRATIAETVTDLERWTATVKQWQLSGYKPTNVSGMLDWYQHGPSQSKRANGKTGGAGPGRQMPPAQQATWLVLEEIENSGEQA